MSNDHTKFTLTEVKRMKRSAARQYSKLRRKVETMKRLRDQTFDINRQIGFLREELDRVSSLMYQPDPKHNDY